MDNFVLTEERYTITCVKLFDGEIPVGYAEIDSEDGKVWLDGFCIRESLRGRGYGQKMLNMLIDRFGVNALAVPCDDVVARHVYEKAGFKVVGPWQTFERDDCLLMERDL